MKRLCKLDLIDKRWYPWLSFPLIYIFFAYISRGSSSSIQSIIIWMNWIHVLSICKLQGLFLWFLSPRAKLRKKTVQHLFWHSIHCSGHSCLTLKALSQPSKLSIKYLVSRKFLSFHYKGRWNINNMLKYFRSWTQTWGLWKFYWSFLEEDAVSLDKRLCFRVLINCQFTFRT